MTHSSKTCIERPRKIGAKYTGKDIGRDEVLVQVKLGWEAKRDQWNGYNPSQYSEVIEEFEMKEKVRLEQRSKKLEEKMQRKREKALAQGGNLDEGKQDAEKKEKDDSESSFDLSDDSDDSDKMDEKDAEALNAQFVDKDPKVRTAVRNLRQREDIAKYLRNLDPNSAAYDGKARIMKENPNPHLAESD